ncbi:MAG: DUF58 domain-containing protein [Planctomycetota bacterium]|nr:DUF58 domain-containing protein [Planctomycetota bacterium]
MQLALPSFSGTKEVRAESLFRSAALRWTWCVYTQGLTRAGRWFLWPTLIFTSYGSTSLELQAYILFAYAFGLWAAALACMFLWRPRVRFQAHHADRVCAGETLPVAVEVVQQGGPAAARLHVLPHDLPREVDAAPEDGVALPPLAPGEGAQARLGLSCQHRGVYRLKGYRVETSFPFGLLRARRTFAEERPLVVYPKFSRLARLRIPTGRRLQPGGVALASAVGDSFEFVGDREYREGDNVRDIDWRATARLNRPIVREYREEYFLRVAVVLDTHVPRAASGLKAVGGAAQRARQQQLETFERAVSLCAAVSDYMARQDYLVDIFAAGPNLYHLTAGRSLAYLDQILDILACVEDSPDEGFGMLEPELMENLAQITSVVCVLLDWDAARRDFVYRLKEHGAGTKVIVVRDTPCTLDLAADADQLGGIPVLSKAACDAGIEEL